MELSAHEKDHLRALVQSQDVDGVTEFMAAKVDGVTLLVSSGSYVTGGDTLNLSGVGTDTAPNEVVVHPEDHRLEDSQRMTAEQVNKRNAAKGAKEE